MQHIERARRRLKLRDLHILLVVAQRGSMAKAAAELAISQPAVSRAIADMEHALGLQLLDRGRNGIEPTPYGRVLIKRAVTIFDELTQGLQELEFLADPTIGQLRIGCSESVAAGLLPAVIDRFTRHHPGIRLNVAQTVLSTTHYRELRERSIDLLLGWIPTSFAEEDLVVESVLNDPRVVVAGRKSKWARSSKLSLADLADEAWILPPPDTFPGSATADLFRESGLNVPRTPAHDAVASPLQQAGCDRALCHLAAKLGRAVRRPRFVTEGASGQASTNVGCVGGYRNAEEPHAEPGCRGSSSNAFASSRNPWQANRRLRKS